MKRISPFFFVGAFICRISVRKIRFPSARKIFFSGLPNELFNRPHIPSFVCEEYMEDCLTVICPADGRFYQGQTITLKEFGRQRFLLREHGSGTRETFDRAIEQAGVAVSPYWEAMSTTALVNAVINGLGITVLPHRMVVGPLEHGLVVAVNVKGLDFKRKFHIIYHKEKFLTSSAKAFIELCRNYELDYPLPRYNGLY